jgi:glycosyltransferase involved in cell wall biosynthesis
VVWRSVLAELRRVAEVKLVRRGRADVWLSPATTASVPGQPLVLQLHEVGWHDPELRAYLGPDFAEHLERHTAANLQAAARVITPSQASRRQLLEATGFPAERVHAVHHGVDHHRFRPGLPGGRDRLGGPYVLFVGVLHPRKNLEGLRSALAELAGRGFPHHLAVIGNPPADRAEPDNLQASLELPNWPGRLRLLRGIEDADVASLMAGADAFCLPSFYEGFGLPALEAMACGAPVVVSDRGALPEVVGEAGLVVAPQPEDILQGLTRVLEDSRLADRLRAAAVRRAAGFSWQKAAQGWLEALRQAA